MPGKETKKCPFCAETIKAAAILCRYCGRDLPLPSSESPPQQPHRPRADRALLGALSQLGGVVLGVAVLWYWIAGGSHRAPAVPAVPTVPTDQTQASAATSTSTPAPPPPPRPRTRTAAEEAQEAEKRAEQRAEAGAAAAAEARAVAEEKDRREARAEERAQALELPPADKPADTRIERLRKAVRSSMQDKFDHAPAFRRFEFRIADVTLVSDGGNQGDQGDHYQGVATLDYHGERHAVPIEVTWDGAKMILKTPPDAFAFAFTADKTEKANQEEEEKAMQELGEADRNGEL